MDAYEHIVHLYDLEHDAFHDDASFFMNLIGEGPVLEVGCGTGRILEHIAHAGLEVHGIDVSQAMLNAARQRLTGLTNAHLHHMSVEKLDLPLTFRSTIWPLNVLWHLADHEAQLRSLRAVRAHMDDGGLLVVDLSNPFTMGDRQDGNEVRLRFQSDDGPSVVQGFSCAQDDEAEQVLHLSLWYDRIASDGTVRRTSTTLSLRYTYQFELKLMLDIAGFSVQQIYGSYDLEQYSSDSPNLLAVARAC
jgi:SAM-dependent methyltransferase